MMNQVHMFQGWKKVFGFTVKQATAGKAFKAATIGLAALIFLIFFLANVIPAAVRGDDGEDEAFDYAGALADTVLSIQNDTEFDFPDVSYFNLASGVETFKVNLLSGEITAEDAVKDMTEKDVFAEIRFEEHGFRVTLYFREEREVEDEEAAMWESLVTGYLDQVKAVNAGLSGEELLLLQTNFSGETAAAGQGSKSVGVMLMEMLAPMVCSLLVYMMVLLYGQSISKVMIAEKTSKLMEYLLSSIKPYGMVFGKLAAMISLAVGQFLLWVVSALAGFFGGVKAAGMIDSDSENMIVNLIKMIQEDAADAFSPAALILLVLVICAGFFFYCTLAAFAASFITKAEELGNAMAMFQLPVIAGFLVGYLVPMTGGSGLFTDICRVFPLTAPFMVPGEILVGNATVFQAVCALAILIIVTFVLIVFTGKNYKRKMFG